MQQTLELQKQTDVMRDQAEQYKYDNIKQAAGSKGMKVRQDSEIWPSHESNQTIQMIQRNLQILGNPPCWIVSIAIFAFTQISLFKTSNGQDLTAYHEEQGPEK